MRSLLLRLSLALVSTAALADAPPPAPAGAAPPVVPAIAPAPWACNRTTLVEELACTIDGRDVPGRATPKELVEESQRQVRALMDGVCAELGAQRPLVAACQAHAARAIQRCNAAPRTETDAQHARRLLDDAGDFNPGHAACYEALAEVVARARTLSDDTEACCRCASERCGEVEDQCVARAVSAASAASASPAASGARRSGGSCAACADACAAVDGVLVRPPPKSTTSTASTTAAKAR